MKNWIKNKNIWLIAAILLHLIAMTSIFVIVLNSNKKVEDLNEVCMYNGTYKEQTHGRDLVCQKWKCLRGEQGFIKRMCDDVTIELEIAPKNSSCNDEKCNITV